MYSDHAFTENLEPIFNKEKSHNCWRFWKKKTKEEREAVRDREREKEGGRERDRERGREVRRKGRDGEEESKTGTCLVTHSSASASGILCGWNQNAFC